MINGQAEKTSRAKELLLAVRWIVAGCLLVGLSASVVWAAEGGGEHHAATGASLMSKWLHFMAFVGLIYLLTNRSVGDFWRRRRAEINEAVTRGEAAIQAAMRRVTDARSKLDSVESEIAKLQTQIARETEHEKAQIIAESKNRAEAIRLRAQASALAEERAAEGAVQREVAETIVGRAREQLMREITESTDKPLRGAALKGVAALVRPQSAGGQR